MWITFTVLKLHGVADNTYERELCFINETLSSNFMYA